MNDFKRKYSYDNLCDSIANNETIKNKINKLEKNENITHFILNDIIKDFNWEYFYHIYNTNFEENNDNYILKYGDINLVGSNKNIKYFDNVELIDKYKRRNKK